MEKDQERGDSDQQMEEIPAKEQYKVEKEPQPRKITTALIMRTSFEDSSKAISEQEKVHALLEIRSIHLQWQRINVIENLEVYTRVNILYLQHNNIRRIEGLETLTSLEYLSLNNNQIERVEGIKHLGKLSGLNLAGNRIQEVSGKEFPENIQLLSLAENPVSLMGNYKEIIIKSLKFLNNLDGKQIDSETKFKLLGLFPNKLSKYSESLRKFREEKEKKQEKKEIFVGRGMVDPDEIVKSLKMKTQEILNENRQCAIENQKQQIKNFDEKIRVSKNLKKIRETIQSIKEVTEQEN